MKVLLIILFLGLLSISCTHEFTCYNKDGKEIFKTSIISAYETKTQENCIKMRINETK
jgi:hypothetical protein